MALCGFAAASVEGAVFRGRLRKSDHAHGSVRNGAPAPSPAPSPTVAVWSFQAGDIVQAARELTGGSKVLVHAGVKGVVLGPATDRFGRPVGEIGDLSVRFDERADLGGVADIVHVMPGEIEAASTSLSVPAAPAPSLVPLALAVYRGCYENAGVNRITGHASDLTFEECQRHAASSGMMYFAFEFPQGSATHGRAQCLMLSNVPSSIPLNDAECEQEQHNGHRLGDRWRIAVYGPEAPLAAPPAAAAVAAAAPAWVPVQPAPLPMSPVTLMPVPSLPLLAGSLCATASSCSRCTALKECGWCAMEQKCVEGTKLGPRTEQCLAYDYMHCTNIQCEARNTCADCLSDRECGWCASKARCALGDASGPFTASSCPAPQGFVGARPVWAHSFSVTKCQDTPPLHSSELWDNLRGIMYRSQTRIARMQAKAVPVPPPPVPVEVPAVPTPPPQYVATTWIMPTAPVPPTTTTVAVPTTTIMVTPCPTQTMPIATAPPPRSRRPRRRVEPQPPTPIEVNVDVNQHVNNEATANAKAGDTNIFPRAPASGAASSPGLVLEYSPAPAPAPAVGPQFPAIAGPPPMPEYGPVEDESSGPPIPGGDLAIEAPAVEVEAPSLG